MERESKAREIQKVTSIEASDKLKNPELKNKIHLSLEAAARFLYHIETLGLKNFFGG